MVFVRANRLDRNFSNLERKRRVKEVGRGKVVTLGEALACLLKDKEDGQVRGEWEGKDAPIDEAIARVEEAIARHGVGAKVEIYPVTYYKLVTGS